MLVHVVAQEETCACTCCLDLEVLLLATIFLRGFFSRCARKLKLKFDFQNLWTFTLYVWITNSNENVLRASRGSLSLSLIIIIFWLSRNHMAFFLGTTFIQEVCLEFLQKLKLQHDNRKIVRSSLKSEFHAKLAECIAWMLYPNIKRDSRKILMMKLKLKLLREASRKKTLVSAPQANMKRDHRRIWKKSKLENFSSEHLSQTQSVTIGKFWLSL